MAITLGVHASAGSSDGNTATTPARAATSGSTLLATVAWDSATASDAVLSDTSGNTWVKVGTSGGPTTGGSGGYELRSALFKCQNCVGGASFALTATRAGAYPSVAYQEFKGSSVIVEASAQALDTSSAFSSGTIGTPASNGAGVFGVFANNAAATATPSVNSPMTVVEAITNISLYYPLSIAAGVQSTAAPISADFTSGGSVGSAIVYGVLLKESGGGGSVVEATGTSAGAATVSGVAGVAGSATGSAAGSAAASGASAAVVSATGTSQASGQPVLGAHDLAWHYEGSGSSPLTRSLAAQSGSTILVLVGGYNSNDVAPTDNKGNTYTRVGTRKNYTLWATWGISAWACHGAAGGADHVVSIAKPGNAAGEVSMLAFEVRGGGSIAALSQTEVLVGNDLTSSITTTGPAVLISTWWGDHTSGPHTATPRDGFTALEANLIEGSIIQCAGAARAVSGAGTYASGWDETPDQGAILELFAIQSTGSGVVVAGASGAERGATGAAAGASVADAESGALAGATGAASGAAAVAGVTATGAVGTSSGEATTVGAAQARVGADATGAGSSAASGSAGAIAGASGSASGTAQASGSTSAAVPVVRTRWRRAAPHFNRSNAPTRNR